MLELNNIVKDYISGDTRVTALKGINLRFRDSEFVSILGQSGCGRNSRTVTGMHTAIIRLDLSSRVIT